MGEGEQEGKGGGRRKREEKDKGAMIDKREGRKMDEQGRWKEK